jgi:hypothetical protein
MEDNSLAQCVFCHDWFPKDGKRDWKLRWAKDRIVCFACGYMSDESVDELKFSNQKQ